MTTLLPDELRLAQRPLGVRSPGRRACTPPRTRSTPNARSSPPPPARGAAALPDVAARRFVEQLRESGIELGVDQAAAVRGILTSGQRIECLVGPAGTGKSFVVGALAHAWTDPTSG